MGSRLLYLVVFIGLSALGGWLAALVGADGSWGMMGRLLLPILVGPFIVWKLKRLMGQ